MRDVIGRVIIQIDNDVNIGGLANTCSRNCRDFRNSPFICVLLYGIFQPVNYIEEKAKC